MNDRIYYSREAEIRAGQQRMMLAAAVLMLGAGIGAVIALLFAPRSGENIRGALAEQITQTYETGRQTTEKALDHLQKKIENIT